MKTVRPGALAALLLCFAAFSSVRSEAQSEGPGLVSFVFDDGFATDRELALDIFREFGVPASSAIVTDWIGRPGFMDAAQIRELQNAGWEIMSHTLSHPNLRAQNPSRVDAELRRSKEILVGMGFDVRSLVYPYNKSDKTVEGIAAKYYRSARGGGNAFDGAGTSRYRLRSFEIKDDPARIERRIDEAAAKGEWLILYHHRIMEKLRIGARGGKFKTGEPVRFSPSGATGVFEPTLWNRIGNSLYIVPGEGSAAPGDRAVGAESGAWAEVVGVGSDDRAILRRLLAHSLGEGGRLRVVTVDGGLDAEEASRPSAAGFSDDPAR